MSGAEVEKRLNGRVSFHMMFLLWLILWAIFALPFTKDAIYYLCSVVSQDCSYVLA
jgi:hypothetical protein